jgi:uncharacterized protein
MHIFMRSFLSILLSFTLTQFVTAADSGAKAKILLITGEDVSAHNWAETTVATREVLDASGKFEVTVVENLAPLDSAAELAKYDVIFLNRCHRSATPGAQAQENLLNFVKNGKGLVVQHLASASFADWPEFRKMVGRYWVFKQSGHGSRSKFQVHVMDKDHPVTKSVADFETDDELYAKLQGDEPVKVLATSDSDWSKKTEPMVMVKDYGKGRVFHHTFGHDGKSLKIAGVAQVIVQGTMWAAKGL